MLALVIRGVVLLGVLGWYSTGVWKMIDSYFKDRFDKYLREEYAKNPRMKADFKSHTLVNNVKDTEIIIAVTEARKTSLPIEACEIDTCPINKPQSNRKNNLEKMYEINGEDKLCKSKEKRQNLRRSKTSNIVKSRRNAVSRAEPIRKDKNKKKRKVKTILLTEEDFLAVKLKQVQDYDFSEFDLDVGDEKTSKLGGIAVEDLPFKPKADIGNLETVTEDEFCPFSLEFIENCRETKKWP